MISYLLLSYIGGALVIAIVLLREELGDPLPWTVRRVVACVVLPLLWPPLLVLSFGMTLWAVFFDEPTVPK